jgi:signal transduction histidine kinase
VLHLHRQPESSQTFLMSATNMGIQALTELRHTLNQLRNDPLEGRSLNQAIDDLIQSFQRMTSIGLLCDIQIAEPIPNRIQVAIYRITEEALMNAYKHSNAQQIQIQINDRNSTLILTIEDNGQGFEINQIPTGFGLRGMRERAEGVGGILTIVSQIHQGCRLQVTIPVLQD